MSAATGDGDAAGVGATVGAAVRGGTVCVAVGEGVIGEGDGGIGVRDGVPVPVMVGAVLPAAGGDPVGEGAAMPTLGEVSPPEPDGAPHAARTTRPTRHAETTRAKRVTT